jgi:hypothetical protein
MYVCMVVCCDFCFQSQWKLRGKGKLCECDKTGKIVHRTSVNMQSDIVRSETGNCTDEEIQRMSHDKYFSEFETSRGVQNFS